MFASILDLSQYVLRNALFCIFCALFPIAFMFICGGVLFLIKGKG